MRSGWSVSASPGNRGARVKIVWGNSQTLHPPRKNGNVPTRPILREPERTHRISYVTSDNGHAAPGAFEARECRRYAHVVAVSPEDRDLVSGEYSVDSVSAVSTGVDTVYFRPTNGRPCDTHSIVFTGSMDWMPNEDAVRFFVEQILPRIRQAIPDATFTVVGRNPSRALVELGVRRPGVIVTGGVDDVRPYMEQSALYLVPLRIGGGTRLKIFEAMAMGLPVVSTRIGAEGLPVTDGQDIVLADSPEQMANAAIQLLTDAAAAPAFGQRGARIG